jgi:hypothetical protein
VRGGMLRPHVQDHGAILPGFDDWRGRQVSHLSSLTPQR